LYLYAFKKQKIIGVLSPLEFFHFIFTLVAGTFILVWFGELISEFGLGNGVSLLIFVGIVGRLPTTLGKTVTTVNQEQIMNLFVFALVAIFVIAAVVFVNEAVRRIPVYYAKRIKGNRVYQGATNFLPLKLTKQESFRSFLQFLLFFSPQLLGNFLKYVKQPVIASVANFLVSVFTPQVFSIISFISFLL
jgi:preprotein translocase subunit SecY